MNRYFGLRMQIAFNKWYLNRLRYRPANISSVNRAVVEQKRYIIKLENELYADTNP
jgi:hypothetical protein